MQLPFLSLLLLLSLITAGCYAFGDLANCRVSAAIGLQWV